MTDPTPIDPTVVIPWYKSAILKGVVVLLCTQIIDRLQKQYHIDFTVFGITPNDAADWILEYVVTPAAGLYIVHARVTKVSPPVTLTKAAAVAANSTPKDPTP